MIEEARSVNANDPRRGFQKHLLREPKAAPEGSIQRSSVRRATLLRFRSSVHLTISM